MLPFLFFQIGLQVNWIDIFLFLGCFSLMKLSGSIW